MSQDERTEKATGLEKMLGVFTQVNKGEGSTALLLAFNVFLLLTSYYIVKPVREALILAGGGAEIKSYASVGQALLLILAVPLYANLASRFPRRRLMNTVTIFFIACMLLFYVLAQTSIPLGVVFFLWVGIFSLMVIAQFWSFANDIYTKEMGERLFPIVAFGASGGAVFGSWITGRLIEPLGVYQLLLLAAGVLGLSLLVTNFIDHRESAAARSRKDGEEKVVEEPMGKEGAFQLVLKNRYLLLIALLLLISNWVNTTGEYILGRVISNAAAEAVASGTSDGLSEGQFIGKFYSDFFFIVNIVGVVIQLFLVSRIVRYLGVRVGLMILPLIALGGYALLVFYPILGVVRWAKTAENATDYSLQNTVRNMLFLPTTREQKYKAKQAIDTFFVRAGDVLSAALVYAGVTWLAFETTQFALVNLVLVAIWLVIAIAVGKEYRSLTAKS